MSDERSANAVDRRLGERLRARRLEIGMSQERLAELIGITFQQVQKYEKGVNRIAASRLYDLSIALDLPVVGFYEGLSGVRRAQAEPIELEAFDKPGVAELVRLYSTIGSDKVRRRVIELVRALASDAQ
jgi:transcriptional regulator with XRE-family HTH domain